MDTPSNRAEFLASVDQMVEEAMDQSSASQITPELVYQSISPAITSDAAISLNNQEITTVNVSDTPPDESVSPPAEEDFEKLPENSDTILYDDTTTRFSSAEWYKKIRELDIVLAGIGGIGSYVAFLLSRLRPKSLFLFDPDRVESVNMAGQLYCAEDVGKNKVDAIARMLQKYSNFYCGTCAANYDREQFTKNIMICGFDNMEARRTYFNSWLARVGDFHDPVDKANMLFIDGRLSAEELQVLCFTGNDTYSINRYYNHYLFSDSEADHTICSYKQTTFMSNMIGSIMINLLVNFAANLCDPLMPRDLPFLTEYGADQMYFKTTN